jgi:predicted alpha/beta hydrolase
VLCGLAGAQRKRNACGHARTVAFLRTVEKGRSAAAVVALFRVQGRCLIRLMGYMGSGLRGQSRVAFTVFIMLAKSFQLTKRLFDKSGFDFAVRDEVHSRQGSARMRCC